jgi:hypothetical protein
MDLFDHYFRTLRLLLPKNEREDIIRELSEEMHSQVADKEAALGRALNVAEQGALLSQLGHPLLTAARYRPQRHLVGPILFPYYWLLVKIAIALIIATQVMGLIVLAAKGSPLTQFDVMAESMFSNALKTVGWITLLAAAAEFLLTRSRVLERWTPRLPSAQFHHVSKTIDDALGTIPGAVDRATRSKVALAKREPTVSGFIVALVLSVWWLLGLKFPTLMFGPAATDLSWGPAMNRLYPILAAAQLLTLIHHLFRLTRPGDTTLNRVSGALWLVTGMGFVYLVASSNHQWLVWNDAADARGTILGTFIGQTVSLAEFVNYTFSAIFGAVALAAVIRALLALLHWMSSSRHTAIHV